MTEDQLALSFWPFQHKNCCTMMLKLQLASMFVLVQEHESSSSSGPSPAGVHYPVSLLASFVVVSHYPACCQLSSMVAMLLAFSCLCCGPVFSYTCVQIFTITEAGRKDRVVLSLYILFLFIILSSSVLPPLLLLSSSSLSFTSPPDSCDVLSSHLASSLIVHMSFLFTFLFLLPCFCFLAYNIQSPILPHCVGNGLSMDECRGNTEVVLE